jgi:[acyl-carrier-protein] S-malonyltransferase
LYVTGIASFKAAVAKGAFDAAAVTAYAGLSLGEYTALHLAGAFSFEDGLRLVSLRGKLMQEAATASPSGMVAIIGGDEAAVRKLCDEAASGEVLVPANFNSPGQIVVSGAKAACERVLTAASQAKLAAKALVVAGAFHSPLMQPAADKMKEALANAAVKSPNVPVYSNVTAQPHTDAESIKRLLVEQIVQPVRWEQTMTTLVGGSEARCIELAPGRTLAGLLKRVNRKVVVEENGAFKA